MLLKFLTRMKMFLRFRYRKQAPVSRSPSYYVWKRLKRNKLAVMGMIIIGLSIVTAILGYLIMPDSTPDANEMSLALTTHKPGFSITMLLEKKNEEPHSTHIFRKMLFGEEAHYSFIPINSYRFEGNQLVIEEYAGHENRKGAITKYSIADVAYSMNLTDPKIRETVDSISFLDYEGQRITRSTAELKAQILKKNIRKKKFWLGTDRFGRDMLSRLMAGTRVSLSVGLISVIISLFIGIGLGSLAGFFRGKIDAIILWLINVVWSIPTLLLVITITLALGKGFWQVFVAVGLTMWVDVARIVRGQIFSIREMDYVEAGRAIGFGNKRLIWKHILPNIMGPVIVVSAANFASAILLEAGLSFLGVGAQPPTPSWGVMIKENYGYIIVDAAYLATLPGLAIMIMVLAFYLVGNGLRDAFDAKETISEMY